MMKNYCVVTAGSPSVLKKIELPIVQSDLCESSLKATRLGSFFRLHSSFICAGGEDEVNACQVGTNAAEECNVIHWN